MSDNIVSYIEMCQRERASLQQGMNFRLAGDHSVILMSVRHNAPYIDRLEEGGTTLIYEGHDLPRTAACPNPKLVDQPERLPSGKLTQNGRFHAAAQMAKRGECGPERVRVYEKIRPGIWAYNGVFHLVDSWLERDENRIAFRFKLIAIEDEDVRPDILQAQPARRRIIPTHVKLEVWKRDGGQCSICGASDELHFDHIVPFTKGGSSLTPANVQLLCARHNIAKRDRIE